MKKTTIANVCEWCCTEKGNNDHSECLTIALHEAVEKIPLVRRTLPMKPCRDCGTSTLIYDLDWDRCKKCSGTFVPPKGVSNTVYKLPGNP